MAVLLDTTPGTLAKTRGTRTPFVAVTFCARGVITGTRNGEDYTQQPGEMVLLDLTEPCAISWPDGFSACIIQIPHAELGLSGDVIRSGVRNLHASHLYELVRSHVARVCAALPALGGDPAVRLLGTVTTDLVRSLIAASGAPARAAAGEPEESLPLRIEHYISEHLGDPALSAQQIAAAHFISVRQLYYLWSGRDCTLAEWIMSERLAAAARELASPRCSATVTAVARRWGFADPGHFSRRFKDKFHVTPRNWRQLQLGTQAR
jgi:AraC-like DNA-binding protein